MHSHRLFAVVVPLAAGSLIGLSSQRAGAQSGGNIELGAFGQYTRPDGAWLVQNGWGFGGRAGVFLTRRWELEATAATSSFNNLAARGGGSTTNQTFTGQINYNIPFGFGGNADQLILEAGAGAQRFGGHSDFTVPLGGGLRFMLGDVVALRFDGIVQYVENPTAATFGFPPTPGVNSYAARSTNVEIRAGLSFLLGNRRPPPPPPARPQMQVPPPRTEPPVTRPREVAPPPPAPTPQPNQDSIARVNRDRDALTAKVYFDFDKSELREDQRAVLDAKLPVLRNNPSIRIRIEGNADERGSDEYNMALGMRRAQTARKYLVDHGIDAARIDISSNGEERPVCQEHNEDCWKQNRRDEFVIVAGTIR